MMHCVNTMTKEYNSLAEAITAVYGSDHFITKRTPISGGDINEAYALTLDDGTMLFMKSNTPNSVNNFRAEAEGLEAIRDTGAIGVPKVLAVGKEKLLSFLLLEYISGGHRVSSYWEEFALELSAMHRAAVQYQYMDEKKYGFPRDNWIGVSRQVNTPHDSWISFFRDCRLKPQFERARKYFSSGELRQIDWLLSHLDRYLVEPESPSLVHGDLWSGNMITGDDGKGWLIDPAVYYGHPEVDIAMTELFGGFPRRFYDAYGLEPGYKDRRDLYNLYQLLNHLNMFGGGYYESVMRVLERYSG